eukprot:7874782-Prorocentrum_lima.AAC.1
MHAKTAADIYTTSFDDDLGSAAPAATERDNNKHTGEEADNDHDSNNDSRQDDVDLETSGTT